MTLPVGETVIDVVGGGFRNKPCLCGSGKKLKRCCGDCPAFLEYCRHGYQMVGYARGSGRWRDLVVTSRCKECSDELARDLEEGQ